MPTAKILIIEPDRDLLNTRTRYLTRDGYEVDGVNSIDDALTATAERTYDLLVLRPDIADLLDMLLARFPADIAALIISSPHDLERVVGGAGAGIRSIIVEPVTARRLRESAARAINARQSILDAARNRTMDILGQARFLLSPGIDIDKFMSIVTELCAAGTGADYTAISMKDKDTGGYRQAACHGETRPGWERVCTDCSGQDVSSAPDTARGTDHELEKQLADAGIGSMMSVLLPVKGAEAGTIHCLRGPDRMPFADSDRNFTAVLAWWAGVLLEHLQLFRRVEQQRTQVDSLLQEISHAQENERKRVAIEIHDGVAQWMVGATYGIKACAHLISEARLTELQAELAKIGQTLQKSVRELRRTIANLRPLDLEQGGLDSALRVVIRPLAEDGIVCKLHVQKGLPELSFPQETTTYWVLQEALTNARAHAAATQVDIDLACVEGKLTMTVQDNGKGFDPERTIRDAMPLEHMGLLGMKERARLLGGVLNIESNPGRGTTVIMSLPLAANEPVNAIV